MYWPVPSEGATPPTARLCGVLPPTAAQMGSPIVAARWAARTALMKEIRAKRTSMARKERKSKRHGHSLDRGSSGGKKSRNGPSPPSYAAAVKGWAAPGTSQDGQRTSTSGSGRKSHASDRDASLRRGPHEMRGGMIARVPVIPRRGIGEIRALARIPPPPLSEGPALLPEVGAEVEARWGPC